jgi:hypothetical protein
MRTTLARVAQTSRRSRLKPAATATDPQREEEAAIVPVADLCDVNRHGIEALLTEFATTFQGSTAENISELSVCAFDERRN